MIRDEPQPDGDAVESAPPESEIAGKPPGDIRPRPVPENAFELPILDKRIETFRRNDPWT
jgi:hypothetical protein